MSENKELITIEPQNIEKPEFINTDYKAYLKWKEKKRKEERNDEANKSND